MSRCLVTGAAGFIGFHTARKLLLDGWQVCGVDNLNSYYDPKLKKARLKLLEPFKGFAFDEISLEDSEGCRRICERFQPTHVIHLAAQVGVRYSLKNPKAYVDSNLVGFQNVLECVRELKPQNFVYASSSSVYGEKNDPPFHEGQTIDSPMSLYAASKICNEIVAQTYGRLFSIPNTGLRFFTVYGPYGRPDMAVFDFTDRVFREKPIPLFNFGDMSRDFTFIDDLVFGILRANEIPEVNVVYNLGRGKQQTLADLIAAIELHVGKKAILQPTEREPGDVKATLAEITRAKLRLGYNPKVDLSEGVGQFVQWYKTYSAS